MDQRFAVDLSGLIEVFGGHLYSSPEVFAREMVQNAVDAIHERRRREPGFEGCVRVRADPAAGTVEFIDDGVGLDREGIETFLSCVARSSKRAPGEAPAEDLIGRFGIGLLSGFLVADRLEVETRAAGSSGHRWTGRIDGHYAVEDIRVDAVGTRVLIPLRDAHRVYARPEVLREVLERHAGYVDVPVWLDGDAAPLTRPAPWREDDPARAQEWLEGKGIHPLFTIPIRLRRERGFAWILPKASPLATARCDVYVKGMLVKAAARDLLPEWAGFAAAVVEAPDLSPTASREDFVRDRAFTALQDGLRQTLLDFVAALPRDDPEGFDHFLQAHHVFVKGACLDSDDLMGALGDRMPFETNLGAADLSEILGEAAEPTLRYVETAEEFAHIGPIASAQGMGLINATYVYDVAFLEAFAARTGVKLEPVDARTLEVFVTPAPGERPRFAGVLRAAQKLLDPLDVDVDVGRFQPAELPALLIGDPSRLRERTRSLLESDVSELSRKLLGALPGPAASPRPKLVLNLEAPLVWALPELPSPDAAGRVVRLLYAQGAILVRRRLSLRENSLFGEDLLSLLHSAVGRPPQGRMN